MSIWSRRGLPVITLGFDEDGECILDAETGQGHECRALRGLTSVLLQAGRLTSSIPGKDVNHLIGKSLDELHDMSFASLIRASAGATAWLDFRAPSGILPALPWETLLEQIFDVQVFRLPRHEILPLVENESLSAMVYVDIAANDPFAMSVARQITDFLASIASCAEKSNINIVADEYFANAISFGKISREVDQYKTNHTISTHSPSSGISWTSRVQAIRPTSSIDLLIIIAPAIVIDHRPSLLMSFGDRRRRPVSAEEIAQCATDLGAWSIGVIGAGRDDGNSGRMLTHELAAARPGPVVAAPFPGDAGRMYRRLLASQTDAATQGHQATGAATAYVHPDGANAFAPEIEPSAFDSDRWERLLEILNEATLGTTAAAAAIPRWLASNQRVLEQFAEPLLHPIPGSEAAHERRAGYAAGMERSSSILRDSYRPGEKEA